MEINNIYIMIELLVGYRRELSTICSRVNNGERGNDISLIANHVLDSAMAVAEILSEHFNHAFNPTEEYLTASKLALSEIDMLNKLQNQLIVLAGNKEESPA